MRIGITTSREAIPYEMWRLLERIHGSQASLMFHAGNLTVTIEQDENEGPPPFMDATAVDGDVTP